MRYKFTICHDCYNYVVPSREDRLTDKLKLDLTDDRQTTESRTQKDKQVKNHTLYWKRWRCLLSLFQLENRKRDDNMLSTWCWLVQRVIYLVLTGSTCYLSGVNWFTGWTNEIVDRGHSKHFVYPPVPKLKSENSIRLDRMHWIMSAHQIHWRKASMKMFMQDWIKYVVDIL